MMTVLVATNFGCRVFTERGQGQLELPGEPVHALAAEGPDHVLAVVRGSEVWRRAPQGSWSRLGETNQNVGSVTLHRECVFAGCKAEAAILRISPNGKSQRVTGFDNVPGHEEWFGEGPPLSIRAMTSTADGSALMATVHVGGIPRSTDGGNTWQPTVPVRYDVHETRAHPTQANVVAAAAAIGLCTSLDGGATWSVVTEGLDPRYSLAIAWLEDEALFSIQDGPFAKRSRLCRWRIGESRAEVVNDGLPDWLDGRIDTAHIGANKGSAAIVDEGGNVWLSSHGSKDWKPIATGLQQVHGILVL
jgi:hypothetical protein